MGAEAYHFFMLAHSQLYQGVYDAAMKTSMTLTNYLDLLDPLEVYSLLGWMRGRGETGAIDFIKKIVF